MLLQSKRVQAVDSNAFFDAKLSTPGQTQDIQIGRKDGKVFVLRDQKDFAQLMGVDLGVHC